MSRLLLGLLLLATTLGARASDLIVKKDGTAMWVSSARFKEDTVYYLTRADDQEHTLPRADVERLLRGNDPGKVHSAAEVDNMLKNIDEVTKLFPAIAKDTKILREQWRKEQKLHSSVTPEDKARMEAQIARAVSRWSTGARTTADYSALVTELGILRFSDVNGDLRSDLDQLDTALKCDYLELNRQRLAALASSEALTFDRWLAISALANEMEGFQPPDDVAAELRAIVAYARQATFQAERTATLAGVGQQPSLGQYLAAATRAFRLRDEVADAALKPKVVALFQELGKALHDSHPEYSLGVPGALSYPLTETEAAIFADKSVPHASVANDRAPTDPPALIWLTEAPRDWRFDVPLKVTARVAFNRAPPASGEYRLVARLAGEATRTAALPDVRLAGEGRALLSATFDFSNIDVEDLAVARRQAAANAANGGTATLALRLEIGRPGVKPKEVIWTPLTLWLPIPLLVP